MSACTCCSAWIHTPQLETSVTDTVSLSKCGHQHDGKRWLRRTYNYEEAQESGCELPEPGLCTGPGFYESETGSVEDVSEFNINSVTKTCSQETSFKSIVIQTNVATLWITSDYCGDNEGDPYGSRWPCQTYSTLPSNYSQEYTTEMLISNAEDLLSSLAFGEWSSGGTALRNLNSNSENIQLRKMKWRIAVTPPITCYAKFWIRRIEQPLPSGTPNIVDLEPIEWFGSGNPCLNHYDESYDSENNRIIITEQGYPVTLPTENMLVSIQLLKWSFVPGYEPDVSDPMNLQPNGFPDPTWEPAAP